MSHRFLSLYRLVAIRAWAVMAAMMVSAASAQDDYPGSKPLKIIVGYPAGGSIDFAARTISDAMAKNLGTTVVIENIGGAAGSIGAQRVVSAPADGYTVLVGSTNELVVTKLINPAQKYDAAKDLTPIGLIGSQPVVLIAGKQTGIATLDEFFSKVKKNPGKFSFGSSGIGSMLHLAGEMAKERAGLFMTHIPYRGTGALGSDLGGGSIEFGFMAPSSAKPFIDAGRVVPIAVTSPRRLAEMPQVPAFTEHPAFKGVELVGWYAVMVPRGTPAPIVARLQSALRATLLDPTVRQTFAQGSVATATGQENVAQLIVDDARRLSRIVDYAKIAN